jgi:HEAT repeat protein
LREQSWTLAAEQFDMAIKADKAKADAAMYWRAHALYQANRNKEAERQIRSLERKHPDSRWIKEAQVLQIDHQGTDSIASSTSDGSGMDEELRMFALSRLMDRDPERALPLVLDTMRNTDSEDVRNDALFVLGMSDEPEAVQAIADIARDSSNPELQAHAIYMLGAASTESSLALLAGLYQESGSQEAKEAIIHAHVAADEPEFLLSILKSEKDPQLQREIIHALGAMDATSELSSLYPTLTDPETKVAALEAFSIAGDIEPLKQVLASETDPGLREAAIYGIAMEDGEDAAEFIESLYTSSTSKKEKVVILHSLVMMDYAEVLALKIVRTESDPELQREAIQILGVMDATDELAELYDSLSDKESRALVLQSMAIADDTDGIIKILQVEQDKDLRTAAIESLAIGGDEAGAEYLLTLYPNGSREEKAAVIQSMMIMDDPDALLSLLKQEKDPVLRREMLQMLVAMDSEKSDEYLFEMLENKG